jgi:hypothetical protein
VLEHLKGFNQSLEQLHPATIQHFLNAVLPATVCASTTESEITPMETAASASVGHAFLASQVQWKGSICGVGGIESATRLDLKSLKMIAAPTDNATADRSLACSTIISGPSLLFVDWLPWMKPNSDVADHISRASSLLRQPPSQRAELRLLPCVGYIEEVDRERRLGTVQARYALVYQLPMQPFPGLQQPDIVRYKMRSLRQLLLGTSKQGLQLPLLETRFDIARSLCRAMLLYHSSGWVHHDFRSSNVLFTQDSPGDYGGAMSSVPVTYDGIRIDKPYVVGFGHARDEADMSLTFADQKSISQTLGQQRLYWSPAYLASSGQMRKTASFQRTHDIYSLGCVMLEIGVWKALETYTWHSRYDGNHALWHKRLLQELPKLGAMCGSRYKEAVTNCLLYGGTNNDNVMVDVQNLAFKILLSLEEIVV